MSSNAENKMYPTIRMRKTKKRVTAATKLQALVRGKLARRTATARNQSRDILRYVPYPPFVLHSIVRYMNYELSYETDLPYAMWRHGP